MKIIDNNNETLKDNLVDKIKKGDKLSIAASCFSMYAFEELFDQFKEIEEFRFIFTNPMFINSKKLIDNSFMENNFEEVLSGAFYEKKLRNTLSQKAIAREFANWIKQENIHFKACRTNENVNGFVVASSTVNKESIVYAPLQGFTTNDLGINDSHNTFNLIQEIENPYSKQYLVLFDSLWKDKKKLEDVKNVVLEKVLDVCKENSPEYIYYIALHNIFKEFLEDISNEDFTANEKSGFKNSVIWKRLFNFQKDAALAIINKLEKYNGCILADSVGLGKTFTALAVIKYYESRNKNVLVLCPKKLSENWNTFRSNLINNPLVEDKFRYDVLYHTDLSRSSSNAKSNGINLGLLNWGNYDLVVIDESHNFRNGGNSDSEKMNRYDTLLEKVMKSGVNTKVLMLSATPVNNKFSDLKNQLQLAYEDADSSKMEEKLNMRNSIDGIFKKAQETFNKWSKQNPEKRTTKTLIDELDYDFFELLDSVTIARSRKQIQSFYDMNSIGVFPKRLKPKSVTPSLTNLESAADYDEIFEHLLELKLTIYTPSHFILPENRNKYAEQFGDIDDNKAFSQENRESGLQRLMAINLMKRLESSLHSFNMTLNRIKIQIDETIDKINLFLSTNENICTDLDLDLDYINDDDIPEEYFSIGKKIRINFCDMDLSSWKQTLEIDSKKISNLLSRIKEIDSAHDNKLNMLIEVINEKINNPINGDNKKVLIFTAFADTAEYLYEHISKFAIQKGLNVGMITGNIDGKTTIDNLKSDFNTVLTWFSPKSKERETILKGKKSPEIDILIGTDCISEGQNLQDCDYCINYDIHWNPVRIIQRYGRVDRIGSNNKYIQLVNFWPDVSLDEYINLKQKVETKMKIVNITSTPEERILSDEEKIDLEYRKNQLEKLRNEIVDIEDISSTVSLSDLGLNEFKLDLLDYVKNNKIEKSITNGTYAVIKSTDNCPPGIIIILKNTSIKMNIKNQNRLHPFYLVYIDEEENIVYDYMNAKEILSVMRFLCKNEKNPDLSLCKEFNIETRNGYDMNKYYTLLESAVKSIVDTKKEVDIKSLFKTGGTHFSASEKMEGLDDFELVCFLVIK